MQSSGRQSKRCGPRSKAHGFTAMRYVNVGPSIGALFLSRRPLAVSGFVSKIIVDAFDGMLTRWPFSHIGKKVHVEGPSGAYFDSPSAIRLVSLVLRIVASVPHRLPAVIGWRPALEMVVICIDRGTVALSHVRSFLERMWSGPMQVLQHLYGSLYFTLDHFFLKGNSMKGVT